MNIHCAFDAERVEKAAPADLPSVTVAIPVLNEEATIEACLAAVKAQTYSAIVEVLVVDGGSTDRTVELASAINGVRVLDNPRRIQAAALNMALAVAAGDVFVRVDGHCILSPTYVECCVRALLDRRAALVGGMMTPVASGWMAAGIAKAMGSRLGAGPARFHVGGTAGWVDTVYLGACFTETGRRAGGYAEDVGVNEDAEFAIRMRSLGGIWFDPSIQSTYTPRANLTALARQFYHYGRSRARTVRRHPRSLSPRQLASPALVLGLASPLRWPIAVLYSVVVAGRGAMEARADPARGLAFTLALPTMHIAWGSGFLVQLCREAIARIRARRSR